MKAEISYHKVIVQDTSPLLRLSLKLPDLVKNLKIFLGADPAEAEYHHHAPARRRLHNVSEESESDQDDAASDSDTADQSCGEEDQPDNLEPYVFEMTKDVVAVH